MLHAIELESGKQAFKSRIMMSTRMQEAPRSAAEEKVEVTPDLFLRFLGGEDSAFTDLYELHNQKIFSYCAKLLGDHSAARDIVHTMWEKIIALRSQPSSAEVKNPTGFFLRMARNLCLDYRKHLQFQMPIDEAAQMHHPKISGMSDEEEIVLEALGKLRDETKEMVVLHYYSGYSFEEIAVMLGKSPNAIWTRVSRARNELKKIITKRMKADTAIGGIQK